MDILLHILFFQNLKLLCEYTIELFELIIFTTLQV